MRSRIVPFEILMLLLGFMILITVTPAAATGIPGDDDGNNLLTADELASNIIEYLLDKGELTEDELRDAAHVYTYWNGAPRTIVDTADRTVTLYKPVKSIVILSSDSARAIRMLGDEKKVVGITSTIQKYPFYFPVMSQQTVVGTWKEVDWEAIVDLKPDLVIVYATGPINAELAAEKLEPFGIAVVGLYLYVADEYDQIFTELEQLAVLLEREEEAARYIAWHDDYLARVEGFVAGHEKPGVFTTYTTGAIGKMTDIQTHGPGTINYLLCENAGGRPITENLTDKYLKVSAEWVLTENPDVIIMSSSGVFGGWDDEAMPAELIDQMLAGKSWDSVNAAVNDQIYAVPWSITHGFEHIYGVVLLTKIFYPEFEIEPAAVYKEYLEEILRVEYPEGEGKVLAYSDSVIFTT